jgi:hypothetical protein
MPSRTNVSDRRARCTCSGELKTGTLTGREGKSDRLVPNPIKKGWLKLPRYTPPRAAFRARFLELRMSSPTLPTPSHFAQTWQGGHGRPAIIVAAASSGRHCDDGLPFVAGVGIPEIACARFEALFKDSVAGVHARNIGSGWRPALGAMMGM